MDQKFDVMLPFDKNAKQVLTRTLELYCITHGWDPKQFKSDADPCEIMSLTLGDTECLCVTFDGLTNEMEETGWSRLPKTVRHSLTAVASRILKRCEKLRAESKRTACAEWFLRVKTLESNDPEYRHPRLEDPMDCDLMIRLYSVAPEHNT